MLLQEKVVLSLGIGSVRSSGRIGMVAGLLVNPHNLHVDALICAIVGSKNKLLLLPEDILDMSPKGIAINDHEHLLDSHDAIRLKPIIDLNFQLQNLRAYIGKKYIGTVEGFAVETKSLFIQKIYIKPTLVRRLNSSGLTFDRSQVAEVSKHSIVFKASNTVKSLNPVIVGKKLTSPQVQVSPRASLIKSYE